MAKYTAEIKIAACKEFLDGKLSDREICQKYGISFTESSSSSILNEWILRYHDDSWLTVNSGYLVPVPIV